ncbi:MAG: plasma-membrane proton-efflux P-type ATPase [Desulfobacteraceae bacterium]|nr:plasma-membrane proton-efflux P-type ATPase [Desulfobacteraceae bacterium]
MEAQQVSSEKAEKASPEELFETLSSSNKGLSVEEARRRLGQYGPNSLEEKKESPLLKFLVYFWGPIPWMIEVALILSLVVKHWLDAVIIAVLLGFNAVIGFWEEHKASNALAALKKGLALKARVLRGGKWQEGVAEGLVPGDIVRLRLGDIIPADVKLIGGDYISVDQAALTGESLPVSKRVGDIAYSGSVAKQGEMVALVTGTGSNTFFGRTAKLVGEAGAVSHFQKAVMRIGDFLIFVAVGLSIILITVELYRGQPALELLQFVLILVIASIPVAMPAVLSVTMALGALSLSREKAIVSRLQSIEEMAGIDILFTDKTGTLTKNELTLGDPVTFGAKDAEELILAGALASKAEDRDAIDLAIISQVRDRSLLNDYEQTEFVPFDPIGKRTEGTVKDPQGRIVKYTKGAPQVILEMCKTDEGIRVKADKVVSEMASKGYRTLGVARSVQGGAWQYLGILPLYDPPREDSAETIAQAKKHGLRVHMVTGDNVAIASEISGQLGIGSRIQPATELFKSDMDPSHLSPEAAEKIEQADGFAQVFPEHKYAIVKALQAQGHLVGMTGDGVNDAPALKQADTGIAVSGATDAARAAAALILTAPGLSVIIKAIEEARQIFERMMSYTIYRIAMTIDIMFFVVLSVLAFGFTPLTAVMIIVLALLDDVPIMTIAYDNTRIDPEPVRWQMRRVLSVSSILGLLAVAETFGLLLIGWEWLKNPEWQKWMQLDKPHLQTVLFLQLVAGGHLMLFLTRTKKFFFISPFPSRTLFCAIVGTQILAVLMCAFGWLVPALPWGLIGLVWVYNIVWMIIQDVIKVGVYHLIEDRAKHKRSYFKTVNQPLHSHPHLS